MSLISLVGAAKDFGIRTLFSDLDLHIGEGERLGLINGPLCLALLEAAALLLVLLALRKFGMEAAADVGDKSVFAYLDGQLPAGTP